MDEREEVPGYGRDRDAIDATGSGGENSCVPRADGDAIGTAENGGAEECSSEIVGAASAEVVSSVSMTGIDSLSVSSAVSTIPQSNTRCEGQTGSLSSGSSSTESVSVERQQPSLHLLHSSTDTHISPTASEAVSGEKRQTIRETLDEVDREQTLLKKLLSYLEKYPANYSAAAKRHGMSRKELMAFLNKHRQAKQELDDALLDEMESNVILAARGAAPENFNVVNALKVLKEKRPENWGGKVKEKDNPILPPEPGAASVGAAQNLIGRWNAKRSENESAGSAGVGAKPVILRPYDPKRGI